MQSQLIWIYSDSPVAAEEIKTIKETNKDGWFITVDKNLVDPHWCCRVGDWEMYNGGYALFSQETGELVAEKDIKKYLLQQEGWISEVLISMALSPLRTDLVKQWLRANSGALVESRGVRDGREWRIIDACQQIVPEKVSSFEQSEEQKHALLLLLEKEILEIKQVIINSFYEIGIRLRQIQDEKLYELKNYKDFKDYVERELSFARTHAYRQIDASQALDDILPSMFLVSPIGGHEKADSTVSPIGGHEKADSTVSPIGGHEKADSTVSPIGGQNMKNKIELKERHIRPLTDKSLTPEDRRQIWERVEDELETIEEEKQKPPKLTAKLVEKAIAQYKLAKNNIPPKTFEPNQICKVKLGTNIGEKSLALFDGKLVRVVSQMQHSVKCKGFWGEEIEEHFHPEELIPIEETDAIRQSVTLPVGLLEELAKRGRSLEDAIAYLLEKNATI